MKNARWLFAGVALFFFAAVGINWVVDPFNLFQKTIRLRLEAHFTFDGKPYTAIGYMECIYQRSLFGPGSRPQPSKGPPIYDGFYTDTLRDAASVVLADGKGAIMIRHAGSCPSLPKLTGMFANNQESDLTGGTWPAYYFPDRHDPKVVWILNDRRAAQQGSGRYVLNKYAFVRTNEPPVASIAKNIPAAWRWYEQMSAQNRTGRFSQRKEDVWSGIVACVVEEEEWRKRADFARAATGLEEITVVELKTPSAEGTLSCPGVRTEQISVLPSNDYSRATLELDRTDLRWAAITTPYSAENRNGVGQWTPEICIVVQGCTGIRMRLPFWIYWPQRRLFIKFSEERLETYRFPHIALRHGDGL